MMASASTGSLPLPLLLLPGSARPPRTPRPTTPAFEATKPPPARPGSAGARAPSHLHHFHPTRHALPSKRGARDTCHVSRQTRDTCVVDRIGAAPRALERRLAPH